MKKLIKYSGVALGVIMLLAFICPDLFIPSGITGAFALAIFTYTPAKNVSGVKQIFIAEKSVATSITVTSNEVSAVAGTTPFMRVDIITDSGKWTQTIEKVGRNNHKISNAVELGVMPPAKATNTWQQALIDGSPGGFYALIVDDNNKCFIVGFSEADGYTRPLLLDKSEQTTGQGLSEEGGNTIKVTLSNECLGLAVPLDSTLTAAVLGGSSTICKWS